MYWPRDRREGLCRIRRYYRCPVKEKRLPLLPGWYLRYSVLVAGPGVNIYFGSAFFHKLPIAIAIDRRLYWVNFYRLVPTSGTGKAVACPGQIPLCYIATGRDMTTSFCCSCSIYLKIGKTSRRMAGFG